MAGRAEKPAGISGADAGRRLAEATQLGTRRTVTGDPLEPELPATAAAQARGEIGADRGGDPGFPGPPAGGRRPGHPHRGRIPVGTDRRRVDPEGLRKVARQLMGYLDQDGTLDDDREHACKRGLTIGRQELDGMSKLSGWVDPELRAALDAVFAKLAAPASATPKTPTVC